MAKEKQAGKKERRAYIYFLCDPRFEDEVRRVRYVGKSVQPKVRLGQHKYAAARGAKKHVNNWIRSLPEGIEPVMEIHEICKTNAEVLEREKYWISEMKQRGCKLTNLTDGGEGVLGCIPSEETRRKMSEASRGRVFTEETRRRLSESHMGIQAGEKHPNWGKHHSEETKQRISASHADLAVGEKNPMYGKRHTEETKRKISESHTGDKHFLYGKHLPEETRRKISEAHRGENCYNARLTWEKVAEIRRLYVGGMLQREIAKQFGVIRQTISDIVRRKRWKVGS